MTTIGKVLNDLINLCIFHGVSALHGGEQVWQRK